MPKNRSLVCAASVVQFLLVTGDRFRIKEVGVERWGRKMQGTCHRWTPIVGTLLLAGAP